MDRPRRDVLTSGRLPRVLHRIHRADLRVFRSQARASSPLLDAVLPRLTRAADHSMLWVGVAGALAAMADRRGRRAAGRGICSIAVASLLASHVAKRLVRRARPPLAEVPVHRVSRRIPVSGSFPSGHSASAAAFAVGVSLEMPELALPLGVTAAAVCWSRVFTGMHYPSDVVFGAAFGAGSAVALSRVVPASRGRSREGGRPAEVRLSAPTRGG